MFTNKLLKSPYLAAVALVFLVLVAGVVSIVLEKPAGALAGHIALQEPGFDLSTYDLRDNKVYAVVMGPRGGDLVERGVWVNRDGSFQINQLPVGEYTLRARAPGFATYSGQGIFVDEGKVAHLQEPLRLALLEPSVSIASHKRVFTTKETPAFWINAQGSNQATVRLYRKNMLDLLSRGADGGFEFSGNLSLYKPYRKDHPAPMFADETPYKTLPIRKLESTEDDWSRAEFKMNAPLPPGEYVAVAEVANIKGKKDWNLMWFSVSDLGLIVKQAPEKTLVRAIDLNTLKPLPNIDVRLLQKDAPNAVPMGIKKTGKDGFAEFPVAQKSGNYNFLALGVMGANRAFGGIDYWNYSSNNYRTYFYTERPIYRLGQMVYFKGMSRLSTSDGLKTPKAGMALDVTVEDPDNNKLWEGKLTTSAHGTFHGTYQIPADAKTGAYQVNIKYPDGQSSYNRFEVAQYRKPEYQVDVLPLDKRITAGGKSKVRIRATYYFGAPVTNARIKYSIYADTDWSGRYHLMPRPDYYGYYDDWSEGDDYYEDQSYAGEYVSEGYAQTDDAGEALIEFDTRSTRLPKNAPYSADYLDKRYTVEAEVTDLSRIAVVGSGKQSVTAGDFTLFVQPENYVQRAGSPVKAELTAVDYEGKPVPNRAVTVTLMRWNWDSLKGEYRGSTTVGTTTATTDATGKARVTLPTTDKFFTDGYYLTAQARDDGGRAIYDQSSIWIASENYPYVRDGERAQQEAFSVKLDKEAYKPGDVARAMITAPVTGKENAQVIVSIEGVKLHKYWAVSMDATAKMIEIPLTDAYAPNVYVTATLVGPKHQFYNQERLLKVSPEAHFLQLTVNTDKPKYKPGETAVYTIKATYPNGKPAKNTELSLGVVDESIYAIRPEAAKDIRKFFYDKQYNLVTTLSSFPEEYSGGPDKIEPRIRKDFRDMAAWLPDLITNDQGVATAEVKLPDNLTTWRATVRGISTQTDVGSTVAKVIATQDLIVRLALPRFFTQFDQGYLTAIVHNYTDRDQKIKLTLNASSQFETKEALVRELTVKPDRAERYGWPVNVTAAGEGLVQVKAVGQTDGDAMELKVPIRALGIEMTQSIGGILKTDPGSIQMPFKIPAGIDPKLAQLLVSVSASAIGPVLGNFDALIDYPYGCTEQTMSRLMPSVIALKLNKALGVSLNAEAKKRFDAVALKSLVKLKDYHNDDGGWGWWKYDASSPYLTAYVMEGLYLLRDAGYPLQTKQLPYGWREDGVAYLQKASEELTKQLSDPKLASDKTMQMERVIDLSYMQAVLSLYNQKTPPVVRSFLLGEIQGASPEALSWMTLAFKRNDDIGAARLSYQELNRLADSASGMLNWDHTEHLRKLLNLKAAAYSYRFTGVEATALALRAAVEMEKDDASRLELIERWLILQRNKNGWDNTKTTAQVLRALMEKAIAHKAPETNFTVSSNLWKEVMRFSAANLYGPEQATQTTIADVHGQTAHLEKQGPGHLYYSGLLRYMLPLKPGDAVQHQSLPGGLNVRRAFYRIQAEPVGPEGQMRFKTHPISGNPMRAGETVLMKVIVECPVALPYVIVESALPSGAEVVSNDPREGLLAADTDDRNLNGDWGSWWWTHQDILDDRLVMFSTSVPAGKNEFHALVRMELPGTFQMNPVKLEGMYSTRIRAYSALDQIKVVE